MEVALRQVEVASDFAGQSGEALTHIVNSVELAADQVRAIATASEQQSATSDEINQDHCEDQRYLHADRQSHGRSGSGRNGSYAPGQGPERPDCRNEAGIVRLTY